MAQDTYARLLGTTVDLSGPDGVFKLCPYCGSDHGYVGKGTGPHSAALMCGQCNRHLAWLSRDHLAAMAAATGRSPEPINNLMTNGVQGGAA